MDMKTAPDGIWSADMRTLDPGQLDKLDYFIAQLKKNGIYADLNLHVSRTYPDMPLWEGMPSFAKGLDNFYSPLIATQRDYARQLLKHVNAYTHNAYSDEPAVAIIEINNENGFANEWGKGALDSMSSPYRIEFDARWNRWLQTKYSGRAALEEAWKPGQEPLGAEMLKESSFEQGVSGAWTLEKHGDAMAGSSCKSGQLSIQVSQTDGVGWHVQLAQAGIAYSNANHYTLAFRAKANAPHRIIVTAAQTHAPWRQLWSTTVNLTNNWKDFRFTFQPSADEKNGRIVFSDLADAEGTYWLADVSLRSGGVFGLKADESFGAVSGFKKAEFDMRTPGVQHDWMAFLYDTESQYWTGMEQYLKEDLKTHSLIVGTATGYSPASIQAKLDVVDGHAYWQHPHFPAKMWDSVNWTVGNISMAGDSNGGTLPGLAAHRVAGMPYICTEYNEAAPNPHSSEAFLLLNAYAALQDWDGVFAFDYSGRHDGWDSRCIYHFFDIDQDPAKMATLPAAVSIFLRGDVSRAKNTVTFPVSMDAAIGASLVSGPGWGAKTFGMDQMLPLQSRVELDFGARTTIDPIVQSTNSAAEKVTTSDTGELTWDSIKGRVMVNTPLSKAFIGNFTEPVQLGGVTIGPIGGISPTWTAITLTVSPGFPRRILITATGFSQNSGMRWTGPEHNSVGGDWGEAPSLAEGIAASITLPAGPGAEAWALDGCGQRKTPVKIAQTGRGVAIEIGPQYQTVWYEVDLPARR